MTKADIIRGLIRNNPEAGPTAIIEIAKTKHKGVKISPQEVSTYKGQLRAAGEAGKPRRTLPASGRWNRSMCERHSIQHPSSNVERTCD